LTEFILNIAGRKVTNNAKARDVFNSLKDGKYLVQIKAIRKRTLNQNSYYWGIVAPMVKNGLREAGYNEVRTNEEAHEVMKCLFLKRTIHSEKNGDDIVISGSTSELTTKEFNVFLEEIWQWAAQYLGIQIPMPNEEFVETEKIEL
jgi:RNA-binding protein YhbY